MNANIEKTQSYWRSSDQQWNVNFVSQLQCWLPERFYMMKVLVFPEQYSTTAVLSSLTQARVSWKLEAQQPQCSRGRVTGWSYQERNNNARLPVNLCLKKCWFWPPKFFLKSIFVKNHQINANGLPQWLLMAIVSLIWVLFQRICRTILPCICKKIWIRTDGTWTICHQRKKKSRIKKEFQVLKIKGNYWLFMCL